MNKIEFRDQCVVVSQVDQIVRVKRPEICLPLEEFVKDKSTGKKVKVVVKVAPVFHVPNGGNRSPETGANMKRLGTRSGIPDLISPFNGGIAIEMKTEAGSLSRNQKTWIDFFDSCGWRVVVCLSAGAAIQELLEHFEVERR